jgi:hypothetical protein
MLILTNMSILEMSEEEKAAIRKQHTDATKNFYQKKADEKAGLKAKPKEEPKKEEPKK